MPRRTAPAIPPLAGAALHREAAHCGLSSEESARLLRRGTYGLLRLLEHRS